MSVSPRGHIVVDTTDRQLRHRFRSPGSGGGLPPPWQMGDDEEVVAELWADGSQAAFVVDRVGTSMIGAVEWRADGGAVVRLPVTNRDAFRSFVLRLLDHAEVLGPPQLRADVAGWLRAVASNQ